MRRHLDVEEVLLALNEDGMLANRSVQKSGRFGMACDLACFVEGRLMFMEQNECGVRETGLVVMRGGSEDLIDIGRMQALRGQGA